MIWLVHLLVNNPQNSDEFDASANRRGEQTTAGTRTGVGPTMHAVMTDVVMIAVMVIKPVVSQASIGMVLSAVSKNVAPISNDYRTDAKNSAD